MPPLAPARHMEPLPLSVNTLISWRTEAVLLRNVLTELKVLRDHMSGPFHVLVTVHITPVDPRGEHSRHNCRDSLVSHFTHP